MSEQNPYDQLGVTENSSFEEIQAAKTRLSEEYRDDTKRLEGIESAYDAVIMDRLRMRQEGRIKVPDRIRFPEKTLSTNPSPTSTPISKSPVWLQGMLDKPSRQEWVWPSGVFFGLGAITFLAQGGTSSLALWLALGTVASLYFINRKENKFGRAFLITLGSLIIGITLGSLLGGALRTSGLSLFLNETQIACGITFLLFWLSSCFLR